MRSLIPTVVGSATSDTVWSPSSFPGVASGDSSPWALPSPGVWVAVFVAAAAPSGSPPAAPTIAPPMKPRMPAMISTAAAELGETRLLCWLARAPRLEARRGYVPSLDIDVHSTLSTKSAAQEGKATLPGRPLRQVGAPADRPLSTVR